MLRLPTNLDEPMHVVALLGRVVEHIGAAYAPTSAPYRRATAMQALLQERCYDPFRTALTVTIASALLLALEE